MASARLERLSQFLLGPPRDPLRKETRQHIALISFFAWVGLGADGLSSSCYGPEEAFLALGTHTELAIYLAMATAVTVFIISIAYIQVIDMFPRGGGGYRVASRLLGPYAGLVSGAALIVDYVLTISISIASGVDALFSLLPMSAHGFKIATEVFLICLLALLNLRGMKESIKILMPIFLGFVVSHVILILAGVFSHAQGLPTLIPQAVEESSSLSAQMGWVFVASLFLKAFSLGGGTYTGLEAVSNKVDALAEPRAKTGRWTMFMVAASLAFMATGIIVLYLLWGVSRVPGETLNATVFKAITQEWSIAGFGVSPFIVPVVLLFETGLLFVAANSGFLAGPSVMANMATDKWMPNFFSSLSSRLVAKDGILLMALSAVGALLITGGQVQVLVVLYSINVFLTFSLSLLGLSRHWLKTREGKWKRKFLVSCTGFILCAGILIVTTVEKFSEGAWMTLVITSIVIVLGWAIHRHYLQILEKLKEADETFASQDTSRVGNPPALNPVAPTAVIIVSEGLGSGMHTLLWVLKLFPKAFHNFVFLSVGEVDTHNFSREEVWQQMRRDIKQSLWHYVNYCHRRAMPAMFYMAYGTDVVKKLSDLTDKVSAQFPGAVFFTSKLIMDNENIFTHLLHNQTAYIMQRRLHANGKNMIILPMKV